MLIETRAFGPINVDEEQFLTFTDPMPGFHGLNRFVVLDPEPDVPFKWLQSVEKEDVCFLITDPRPFFPDYKLEVKASALADLDLDEESQTAVAVILTVPDDLTKATANLLAPIVFNTAKKLARQVILDGSNYPVRAPLLSEEKQVSNDG